MGEDMEFEIDGIDNEDKDGLDIFYDILPDFNIVSPGSPKNEATSPTGQAHDDGLGGHAGGGAGGGSGRGARSSLALGNKNNI